MDSLNHGTVWGGNDVKMEILQLSDITTGISMHEFHQNIHHHHVLRSDNLILDSKSNTVKITEGQML